MRYFLVLITLIPFITSAQLSPIQFQGFSKKDGVNSYNIDIKCTIPEGWYIYAENLSTPELDALSIEWKKSLVEPEKPIFNGHIKEVSDKIFENKNLLVYTGTVQIIQKIQINGVVPPELKYMFKGFISNGNEFLPLEETGVIKLEGGVNPKNISIKLASIDLRNPVANCGGENKTEKGLLSIFLLGFIGGLISLLTPCVFPMIPVTVSFFTNRATNKKLAVRSGAVYGFFIFLIYFGASLPFHILTNINPEIFNVISTNAWVNLFFFVVFVLFAFSFFGFFEITLPGNITSSAANKSSLGSLGGIFFMALTLALVSFSCTGPILGSLLVGSLSSNAGEWQLSIGMSGFGLALALPFSLFAMFPNWLKSLPKSGGWMVTVKIILAFVELALALKFLSNADLVMHWGILKREVFIGVWLAIAISMAFYLFGLIHFPHDTTVKKVNSFRRVLGTVCLLFALYLLPGLSHTKYANLRLLSGFPPPLSYSLYGDNNINEKGVEPKVINDYQKALEISKKENKPLLIDFTGWACVNCRKMEEQIWTQPEIASIINDKFILVSLYVDDRQKLPTNKMFTYKYANGQEKDIETLGDHWATFQAENFNQASQPLYVILNSNEILMNKPVGYTPSSDDYKEWLNCGLQASRKIEQLGIK